MNAFWIFFTIVTTGYFIYYAVTIMKDMYGKKEEVVTEEENIDVPQSEESPTAVNEENPLMFNDDGETPDNTDNEQPKPSSDTEENNGNEQSADQPSQDVGTEEASITFYDPEHPEGISSKEKLRRTQLGFEETDVESTGKVTEPELKEMLLNCTPSHPAVKIKYDRI